MKKRILAGFLVFFSAFCLCACQDAKLVGSDADASSEVVKILDVGLTEEEYGIGVNKDEPEILASVNSFILESKKSGELDEIINRYMEGGTANMVTSAELDESKDQLVVVSTLDFEPFEYGEIGEYYGIDMEIIDRLAKYMDKELVIINSSFETMFLSVKQHKCDICIGGITITEDRREFMDFSEPYYRTAQNLILRKDDTEFDNAKTPEAVEAILRKMDASKTIGVENLTTSMSYCKGEDGYEGFPLTVKGYRDVGAAIAGLIDGDCDYVMADDATAKRFVDKANGAH